MRSAMARSCGRRSCAPSNPSRPTTSVSTWRRAKRYTRSPRRTAASRGALRPAPGPRLPRWRTAAGSLRPPAAISSPFVPRTARVVWRKHVGPVEFRPSLDGDLLVVSIVDGQIAALDVRDGTPRWTTRARRVARRTAGHWRPRLRRHEGSLLLFAALVVGPHRGSPESRGGAARAASR